MNKKTTSRYFLIITAAGIGRRMQQVTPKQYLTVRGKTIIEYTLETLLNYPLFTKCIVLLNKADQYWHTLNLTHTNLITAEGGKERHHSVYNGLLALAPLAQPNDWIVVHDAVRPLLQISDLQHLITEIGDHSVGGLLGFPVKNTLKRVNANQHSTETIDRESLWQALTPQLFRYHWLLKALTISQQTNKKPLITDEASAIEKLGQMPKMILGRSDNIKITDWPDLALFDAYQRLQDGKNY